MAIRMTTLAPLEDPTYQPVHVPISGRAPDVVAKWGPRSQVRWFERFVGHGHDKYARADYWDRFYVESELHRGLHCSSCVEEQNGGYQDYDPDWCCCRATRRREDER